jgi:hypothetical protein
LRCVVRQRERFHEKRPEHERAPGRVCANVEPSARARDGNVLVGEQGRTKGSRDRQSVPRVVAVVMGNEDPERRRGGHQVGP